MSKQIEMCEEVWKDLEEEMSCYRKSTTAAMYEQVQWLKKFYYDRLCGYSMKNPTENRVLFSRDELCCVYVPDNGHVPFQIPDDDAETTKKPRAKKLKLENYLAARIRFIFRSACSLNEFAKKLPHSFYFQKFSIELQIFHSDAFPSDPEGHRDFEEERENERRQLAEWMEAMEALPQTLRLEVRLVVPFARRHHLDLDRETKEFRAERSERLRKMKVLWIKANGEDCLS